VILAFTKNPSNHKVIKNYVVQAKWAKCQTPSKTQTNGQRKKQRTDARNRIWCIL